MDKLPELALISLFKHLPLSDQLKYRGTCKKWKELIESLLLSRRELVIFFLTTTRPLIWSHNNRPVDCELSSLIVNEKFKMPCSKFKMVFKNVQRMCLVCRLDDLIQRQFIGFFNEFRHLQHLQVDTVNDTVLGGRLEIGLHLPNLKSFFCNTVAKIKEFHLDCPQLEMLSVPYDFRSNQELISFKDTLKVLKVSSFFRQRGSKLPELPNLEVLACQDVQLIDLIAYKKLKEIHFESPCYSLANRVESMLLDLQAPLRQLFEKKRELDRNELQIYYQGVRCTAQSTEICLRGEQRLLKSDLNLVLQDSEDLRLEQQRKEFIYKGELNATLSKLSSSQAEQVARCLVQVNLQEALGKDALGLHAKFKILFRYVQKLWLNSDIRTQRDLDRLPDFFPHLLAFERDNHIQIYNAKAYPDRFDEDKLNFCFLARFETLHTLSARGWRISADELKNVLQKCRFLRRIEISEKVELLSIGQIKAKHTIIKIVKSKDYEVFCTEYTRVYPVHLASIGNIVKKSFPKAKIPSPERVVACLNRRGFLRTPKKDPKKASKKAPKKAPKEAPKNPPKNPPKKPLLQPKLRPTIFADFPRFQCYLPYQQWNNNPANILNSAYQRPNHAVYYRGPYTTNMQSNWIWYQNRSPMPTYPPPNNPTYLQPNTLNQAGLPPTNYLQPNYFQYANRNSMPTQSNYDSNQVSTWNPNPLAPAYLPTPTNYP